MSVLEVFYDYACPYCMRGHEYLTELIPSYPEVKIEWRPCEAHPRPERYGPHSDLCARGMFYAREHGADLAEYHSRMYRAALIERADIEDLENVSRLTEGLFDCGDFYKAMLQGAYINELDENNRLAWDAYDFPAVPSYRMGGSMLKSVPDVGVSKRQLADFIKRGQQRNYANIS